MNKQKMTWKIWGKIVRKDISCSKAKNNIQAG